MHPVTLQFPSRTLEREFRREVGEASRRATRATLVIVAALYMAALAVDVPREELLHGAFYIPSALLLGVLAAYTIERYARHAFLHERAIEEERARAERLLLNVLPAGGRAGGRGVKRG